MVGRLRKTRLDLLQKLVPTQTSLFQSLVALHTAQREVALTSDEYESYIDGLVLWIRSASWMGPSEARDAVAGAVWFVQADNWMDVVRTALASVIALPPIAAALFLALLALVAGRWPLRSRIAKSAASAQRHNCQVFHPTALSMLCTLLLAALWPAVLLVLGWALRRGPSAGDFAHSLGQGLLTTGWFVFLFEFVRQVCCPNGLAAAHFDWNETARRKTRRHAQWLVALGSPLLLVMATLEDTAFEYSHGALGRFCALGFLSLIAVLAYRGLRPAAPCFSKPAWPKKNQVGGVCVILSPPSPSPRR